MSEVKGLASAMLSMAKNAEGSEVHVAWPKEKAAVMKLVKLGLVTVRKTTDKCAGFTEWWYRLAPMKADTTAPWS